MNPNAFQYLCKHYGLFSKQVIQGYRLTEDFTNDLDLSAAAARDVKCWRIWDKTYIPITKTVILTGWYFNYLNTLERDLFIRLLDKFIEAGIGLCIPSSEGLIPVNKREELLSALSHFIPLSKEEACVLAARMGIKRDNLLLIDSVKMNGFTQTLQHNFGDYCDWATMRSKNHKHIPLPMILSPLIISNIETHVQPDDALSVLLNPINMALLKQSPTLCAKVQFIELQSGLDDAVIEEVLCHFKNLKGIDTRQFRPTGEQVIKIFTHNLRIAILFNYTANLKLTEQFIWQDPNNQAPLNYEKHFIKIVFQANPNNPNEGRGKISKEHSIPDDMLAYLSNTKLTPEILFTALKRLKPNTITLLEANSSVYLDASLMTLTTALKSNFNPFQNVQCCNFSNTDLSADGLSLLFKQALNLSELNISSCQQLHLGHEHLNLKGQRGKLKRLRAVRSSLTTEQLNTILAVEINLFSLDISSSSRIDGNNLKLLSGQLPNLGELSCLQIPFSASGLQKMFAAAPNIEDLVIGPCTFEEEVEFRLNKLTYVKLNKTSSISLIKNILNSPYLLELYLDDCHLSSDKPLLNPGQSLNRLSNLSLLNSSLSINQTNSLLHAAPYLRELSILNGIISESEEPGWQLKNLSALRTLVLCEVNLPSAWIQNLLANAVHLEHLELININSSALLYTSSDLLFDLRDLELKLTLSSAEFARFIHKMPNLTNLRLFSSVFQDEEQLTVSGDIFEHLTMLNAEETNITFEQLQSFLCAAPNLQLVLYNPLKISPYHVTLLQRDYPNSAFKSQSIQSSQALSPQVMPSRFAPQPQSTLSLYTDFFHKPQTHHVSQIFLGTARAFPIHPSKYHLEAYRWMPKSGSFELYQPHPDQIDIINPDLVINLNTLVQQFTQDTNPLHYHAPREYTSLKSNIWYFLPATSAQDKLLRFASSIPGDAIELGHDRGSGYHFFRVKTPCARPVLIDFVIETGLQADKFPKARVMQKTLTEIKNLRFDSSGQLMRSEERNTLIRKDPRIIAAALQRFCSFDESSAPDVPKETPSFEILNTSIIKQGGACRHRAQLFAALGSSLGLNVFYISNGCHAFSTVTLNNETSFTLDLGGAEAYLKLTENPTKIDTQKIESYRARTVTTPAPVAADSAPRAGGSVRYQSVAKRIRIEPPSSDNRFQIWNNKRVGAQDAGLLVREAVAQSQQSKRQLLITINTTSIEALHHALVKDNEMNASCFYTPHLDTISLSNACLDHNGNSLQKPTPLMEFIQRAEEQPDNTFTWFINWSGAEAQHSALNCIIDMTEPRIRNQRLPDNLKVVVMIEQASFAQMGEEFHSRLQQRSYIPQLPSPPLPAHPLQLVSPEDVVLAAPDEWKKVLLEHYTVLGKQFTFIPGTLLTSQNSITIHNAPWHDAAFRTFVRELEYRHVYCNGEWHDLHEHLEIHFATPVFAFPEAVFDTTATPADGIHLALNESTWDSFFSMVQFTPEGLISKKGLLEYGSVVHLHVTDMINEAKWYLLAKRAESLGVKLVVVPAPKVELPPALLRVCKPRNIQSLNPVAPIRVYGTNDMDFVLSKFPFPTDCVVPISKDTRFESLFIEAQFDMQGNLIGEDSDLLKALRTGKHVVLKGSFSTELVQKLHSLFTIHGLLIVNGRPLKINPSGSLTFITESKQAFNNVNFMPVTYRPYREFEQLDEILRSRLKDCYQKLKITPRFSHFVNFPQDKALHMRWLEQLEKSLHLAAGVALDTGLPPVSSSSDSQASIEKETSPQDVIDFLYGENDHPFVFLVSESGTGKTFLMRTALPEYAQGINDPIKVYNGMSELKQWLIHIEGKAILFIDEANISSEQYHIFDNLTRGERVIWFDGKRYELAREQKIVFAGNPYRYGGRLEADLFRRFPLYLEFKAHPLELILDPILDIDKKYFQEPEAVLALVQKWYRRAQIAGLNITPRNAQMMCMRAYELKFSFPYFEEQFLVHYAILEQLKTLYADKEKTREIRGTMKEKLLKDDVLWKAKGNDLKKALTEELPKMSSELWVWTPSRQKIAITLLGLLHIQQLKKDNYFDKSHGISGFLLEGIQGLGKSRMLLAVLREKNIPYLIIPANDPVQARALLLQAFRQGIVAVMDEINSFPDEKLLNDLLSGIDPEFPDNKPIPGFCLLATQNPAFFNKKEVLSKALDNRFMTLTFKEYSPEELQTIIMNCFKLKKDPTDQLIAEWTHAKDYARQEGFFLPDTRTLFAQAQEDMEAISQAQVEDDPEDEGERREKNDNPAPIKKQRI